MSRRGEKHRFHFKNVRLSDPAILRFGEWSGANQNYYERFRQWLKESRYSDSALGIYGSAVRTAMGFLRKEYWQIDPELDIPQVLEHLEQRPLSPATRADYRKGLAKFAEFVRVSLGRPKKPKELRWAKEIGPLSAALQQDIREFLRFCQHYWKEEQRFERSAHTLYTLSRPLRWMADHFQLNSIGDLTPQLWYAWLDHRLEAGISPNTCNTELSILKHFVAFLREREHPVCERFLMLERLNGGNHLPKDVPIDQLRRLQKAIHAQIEEGNTAARRMGRMDLAWFLLMLHSGLRTGEIRNLRLKYVQWAERRLCIEQSKGLKDRLVPMSDVTIHALQDYLEVRGPTNALPQNIFIFRHGQLTRSYCFQRLETYGKRCGVGRIAPHRLRHSCATLLLNSGAPVLAVQTILGHKQVGTTLGYARLYDGTVAADYYSAMNRVERQLALPEDSAGKAPSLGELIALTDALHRGTLNHEQAEIVRTLREGLSLMAEKEMAML